MEKKNHFSHEDHLLILQMKGKSRDDEILEEPLLCHGCQTQITPSEPFYSCENNCTFFLHKLCVELATHNFFHPMHSQHPLTLLEKPPYVGGECKCYCCGQSWGNFTYHCETCNFDLDIICATLEARKLKHPSHQHALMPVPRLATFECRACGETEEDASYICSSTCSYWIHEKCALLPDTKNRKDHDHPLSLAYSLSDDYIVHKLSCRVCDKRLMPYHWIYHCSLCRYAWHLKCIETETTYLIRSTGISRDSLLLPTDDFAGNLLETNHFRNRRIKEPLIRFRNETSDLPKFVQRCLRFLENEIHGHSIIYFDVREDNNTRGKEIRCDACADRIVSICCKLVNHHYFLHVTCALQQETIPFPSHEYWSGELKGLLLRLTLSTNSWDFFKCNYCKLECNGYYYECLDDLRIDVKCALLPSDINHEAHSHRLVHKGHLAPGHEDRTCNGCGDRLSSFPYRIYFECTSGCKNYVLGYGCALLPKTTRHRWDKHPLILSFPPFSDHIERFYCEVCEEEIHPLRWQYRCRECDQSFHPRCIPQASSFRNIKFGINVDVDKHPHTLTLIREANEFRSACHICQKSLYGLRAFSCAPCKFYMCHNCLIIIKRAAN